MARIRRAFSSSVHACILQPSASAPQPAPQVGQAFSLSAGRRPEQDAATDDDLDKTDAARPSSGRLWRPEMATGPGATVSSLDRPSGLSYRRAKRAMGTKRAMRRSVDLPSSTPNAAVNAK